MFRFRPVDSTSAKGFDCIEVLVESKRVGSDLVRCFVVVFGSCVGGEVHIKLIYEGIGSF